MQLRFLRNSFGPLVEVVAIGGKNSNVKIGRKSTKRQKDVSVSTRGNGRQGQPGSPSVTVQMNRRKPQKSQKTEPLVKEEGEMSDNEEVYEQFKEVKWMEWCEDVMMDEEKTLKRFQKLQSTSADLPKEKVLAKIRNYLQLIGRRIDQVVSEYDQESYRRESMKHSVQCLMLLFYRDDYKIVELRINLFKFEVKIDFSPRKKIVQSCNRTCNILGVVGLF